MLPAWVSRDTRPLAPTTGLSVGIAVVAAASYLLLRLDAPAWCLPLAWIIGVAAGVAAAGVARPDMPGVTRADLALSAGVMAAAALWAWRLFGGQGVLPVGDSIAAPQFARVLAQGRLLSEAFPPGSSGHAYPAGYPALLAPFAGWLSADQLLLLFKLCTVGVTVLIPAAWATFHRALFAPGTPLWLVLGASYGAFIVAERTLGFMTALAAKNAVYLALLLFPGVALTVLALARRKALWFLAVAPLLGLLLVHYSMLHLAAAVLGAFLLVGRRPLVEVLRVAAVGAGAALLLLVLTPGIIHDPRAGGLTWSPVSALQQLAVVVFDRRPVLVIFHDAAFGLAPSSYRVLQMVACVVLAFFISRRLQQPEHARGAATYGLAFALSLMFGIGLVPAGITFDFVRSYVWAVEAAIYMTAGLAAWALWRSGGRVLRWAGVALGAVALALILPVTLADARVERGMFQGRLLPTSDVTEVMRAVPQQGACLLIGESDARPEVLVVLQRAQAWNYVEAASPCLFLNGSWVQPGWPMGRSLDGYPAPETLRRLPRNAGVFFVGQANAHTAYVRALEERGVRVRWQAVASSVGGASVWRMITPGSAKASPQISGGR